MEGGLDIPLNFSLILLKTEETFFGENIFSCLVLVFGGFVGGEISRVAAGEGALVAVVAFALVTKLNVFLFHKKTC